MSMDMVQNQSLSWPKRMPKDFKIRFLLSSFCEHELIRSEIVINNRKELKIRIPWELRSTFQTDNS